MPRQQIIWTALPNGLRGTGPSARLKLSVFVSPRLNLEAGAALGTLDAFPDFLDWPERMRSGRIAFKVIVNNDVARPIPAEIVTSPQADSELWKALFNTTTPVRSHEFEETREPLHSYPASGMAASIAEGYVSIAQDSPYRPANKDVVKAAFPGLVEAMGRGRTRIASALDHIRRVDTLSPDVLARTHQDISDNLLRDDPNISFTEKLAAATAIAGELARSSTTGRAVPIVPATPDPASPFIQFAAFHARLPAARAGAIPHVVATVARAADIDIIDFHQMISALGEYPHLLRRLGVVIDLEIAATDTLKSSIGRLKHLRIEPVFTPPADSNENYTPVTKYIFDDHTTGNPLPFPLFAAAPRRAAEILPGDPTHGKKIEIVGGLLNLRIPRPDDPQESNQFNIVKIDVDGAGKKVLNAITTIVEDDARPGRPIDTAAESAAPTLRASGLSLVRSGQADALNEDRKRAGQHEEAMRAGREAEFFAEDLVRGYRIDVRRFPPGSQEGDPAPWLSLHERIVSFAIKRPGMTDLRIDGVRDEGGAQPSFVQETALAPGMPNPMYVHESFCHWQGWSLSAPPPANPVDLSPAGEAGGVASTLPRVDIVVEPVPGSLPRLRYGSKYQLRARIVDLAGNGLTLEEATGILEALRVHGRPEPFIPIIRDELPYRRYDPVPSPTLALREELTEGEALDVMVIRSNGPSTTTASYAASLGDGRYKGVNERHIAPPKTSQSAAETHGALDGAFGPGGDPIKYFNICRRDSGSLNDNFVTNLATGEREFLPDVVDPATGARIEHGIRFIKVEQPASTPGSEAAGYTVHYEARLRLPYLPDPLARGAALFGLPGADGKTLVLKESGSPDRPAELTQAPTQVLPQRAIDALGYVTKISFGPSGKWPELLPFLLRLDGAASGPQAEPKWSEENGARVLTVRLTPGETKTAWISSYPEVNDIGLFGLHYWWDRLGSPEGDRAFLNMAQHGALSMLTPARKLTLVHAVQQPIIAPTPDGVPFDVIKFPDATLVYVKGHFKIHGLSTAKLDLLAAWKEPEEMRGGVREIETHVFEFPIHRDADQPPPADDSAPIAKYIRETDRVEFLAPADEGTAGQRKWLARHEFNDTKHRMVTYRLVATTRFREFFPERITSDVKNITRETTFPGIIVKSSAPPPVPEISHIVPSFGWEVNSSLTRSKRLGGGLRVYLGPTWYASGEGESLAIVGDPQSGADPIHVSPNTGASMVIRPAGTEAVVVPGPSRTKIYPFPVYFDEGSGLWYSDLLFDIQDAYFPFVKLTLARYQRHSLDRMHLSPPVEAGIHQLAPDRVVELEYFDFVEGHPGKRKIAIKIKGSKASADQVPPALRSVRYSIDVKLEERQRVFGVDERDEHLGWTAASPSEQPVADTSPSAPPILWQGHLLVPQIPIKEQRIVIREYELFARNEIAPGQGWIGEPADGPSRRLVYADVIPVS
jgi:hypothetical protein